MGLRNRFRFVLRAAQAQNPVVTEPTDPPRAHFSSGSLLDGPWSAGGIWGGVNQVSIAPRISREEALQVPAVQRARNLICGTISSLPLRTLDRNLRVVDTPLLRQIDPTVANVVTMSNTVEDLLFEAVAWWRIRSFGWDEFPYDAEWIPAKRVHVRPDGTVTVDGVVTDSAKLIRFDSPNPALLVHAARAIRRALRFEQAAERYARSPGARGYFSPADGADPADDGRISELLANWRTARNEEVDGYVPAALKYNPIDVMSPADLQLAQLQERAALDIANCTGLDPEVFGVSTTSRTYSNVQDRRQDRINETLSSFMLAITGRLSMNDVTKRGQMVDFDLDAYMRADPKTRAEVAKIQHDMGALDVDEYRADEGRPALSAAQKRALAPKDPEPAAQPPERAQAPAQQQNGAADMARHLGVVNFTAAEMTGQQFTFEPDAVEFRADAAKRTVSGMLLPFGQVGRNKQGRWRFAPGSLDWNKSAVSRVKLNREHDRAQLLGAATAIRETGNGVTAAYKVARGPVGDQALSEAEDGILDGLSPEVDILEYAADPADPDVFLVTKARLTGTALTATPAFDDARLTSVTASAHSEGNPVMTTATTEQTAPAAPAAAPVDHTAEFTAALSAFTDAVARLGQIPQEQRQVVPAGRATVREPLVYSLDGRGYSFVRDAWEVKRGSYGSAATADAFARLKKYEEQSQELAQQAFNARVDAQFANTGNTTDQAQIIPPGYRPDLYVGQIPQGRPLYQAMSRGVIDNPTPFKVPVWVGSSGLSGTNVEGTGPSTGTITNHTFRTVSPSPQSGEFIITRELADAANPAIDQIALAAMREEYAQDTEAVIADAIAAATDDGPHDGQSTEGCYTFTSGGQGDELAVDIRYMEGKFATNRMGVAPDRMLLSSQGFTQCVSAVDTTGRPLFPFVGPGNAMGTVGRAAQSLAIDGLEGVPAWSLSTTYNDVLLFNHVDAWAWESPLLSFRFEEKAGPENIVLNIWGYFAFQILRYTGIHTIAFTAS